MVVVQYELFSELSLNCIRDVADGPGDRTPSQKSLKGELRELAAKLWQQRLQKGVAKL